MPARPAEGLPQAASPIATLRGTLQPLALLFAGVLLPLWLFAALAGRVHALEDMGLDDALLRWLDGLASPGLDVLVVAVTRAGYEYGVIPADVLLALGLLAWRRWREAVFAIAAFAGSAVLNVATKQAFQRERPSLWASVAPEDTFSFPSGHAMGSMTLAVVCVLLAWHTRWRWPVLALASAFTVAVGVSRLYLGVHYPSDVIAGWAAGLAWAAGAYLVLFRRCRPWRRRAS
ncbi:hypothetical protein B1992_00675 [Pseudoxanthomonas broegbernensis]|uniref:undecaprenyl-diphosphate phosphatase n=1 Tax=Pseudoxanthomonas broegbernensis TaxID=83619 RepID=A0A7V8GPU8_9GAMM|nr:phosphatase PAP2 family protein [Pseudoxanthomonas broegbernensis]KAF1687985.1 hypothetical protein B1992_00675 [Pseudoxanthomonas broegbernensis]MBB6065001.1 undecaprenyl-diphosphatase [Pseudoxanthomonas broegbernensis]